ncbi:MAG: DUF2460 domain-containing protein, partial [Pseudomonadota bacterium]
VTGADQVLGVGDGVATVFQLSKSYASGPSAYIRPISKPVAGSVQVMRDGAPLTESADFTVDDATGEIAFAAAPEAGATLTAGCEFHVPARFDMERLEINLANFEAGEIPSIPVVEVRV